jgi:uncharacterized small protein (DUF1192 family)
MNLSLHSDMLWIRYLTRNSDYVFMQELRGMVMVQQQMLVRLLAAQGLAEHEPSDDLLETVCLLEIRCDTLRDENARLTAELRKRSSSPLPQQMQP